MTASTSEVQPGKDIGFTRFVLPFQWRKLPWNGPSPTGGFRKIQAVPQDKLTAEDWLTLPPVQKPWEHSYFMHEVDETLHKRAGWFRLGKDRELLFWKFRIRPAGLILFEVDAAEAGEGKQGLLVLQAEAADPGSPPGFTEWLEFNEQFRYVLSPYPRKEKELGAWFRKHSGEPSEAEEKERGGQWIVERWLRLLREPVETAPGNWIRLAQAENMETMPTEHFPYSDSRAYVWSALVQPAGEQTVLCGIAAQTDDKLPETCGAWVKALNVDWFEEVGTDDRFLRAASPFERKWAENLTYRRWAHTGTLYGFTPHSGLLLTHPGGARNFGSFLRSHFAMAALTLVIRQRLAALRLRLNEVTRLHGTPTGEHRKLQKEVTEILREMLEFTNLYWFPQISNQQQAQEMYPLLRDAMELEDHYRDLRRDIEATEGWLRARQAEEQAKVQIRFAWIAGVGLVLTSATSMLAIPDLVKSNWPLAAGMGLTGGVLLIWALWWRVKAWITTKCEESSGDCDCRKR